MIDYLELGPSPCDEDCEQLGANYDPARARLECRALKRKEERPCNRHD